LEYKAVAFAFDLDLVWGKADAGMAFTVARGLDLSFYRFAFPPARHNMIIRLNGYGRGSLDGGTTPLSRM